MAESSLDRFRRPGMQPVYAPSKELGSGQAPIEYKAFQESPGAARLWFKTGAAGGGRALPYGYLTDFKTDNWSIIALIFSISFPGPVVVEIHGENMGTIAEAIATGSAAWVEQFNTPRHKEPADGLPIIREIVIHDKPPENLTEH